MEAIKEFEKFEHGEALEGLIKYSAIVVRIDDFIEQADLILEQENTKITLSVFVSNRKLYLRVKDLVNINLKKIRNINSNAKSYLITNGALKGTICFDNTMGMEICSDEYENDTFKTEWYQDERTVIFKVLDTDIKIVNKGIPEVYMTMEDY